MPYIAYPYPVKHEGVDYPPHAPIRVDDPARYPGAEALPDPKPPKPRPVRRKSEVTPNDPD